MERVDIAIVGTGPAGISAALTARARGKSILLFGFGISEKVSKTHMVRNYPGLPDVTGEDFSKALMASLESMQIEITRQQVTAVYAMSDYFGIQTPNEMYEASSIIIATGVVQGKPLPGESEFLGRGVSYCATCDAFFYKDKDVAVLGYNDEAEKETRFLAEGCRKVYYIPVKGKPQFIQDNITVINEKPVQILGDKKVSSLETEVQTLTVDGVFILKDAVNPATLVPGLEIVDGHVTVDLMMRSNIPGCFACGDVAGKPYQYVKSAGQGNIAALSAVEYLTQLKNK